MYVIILSGKKKPNKTTLNKSTNIYSLQLLLLFSDKWLFLDCEKQLILLGST